MTALTGRCQAAAFHLAMTQVKAEVAQGDASKGAIQENVRLILGLKKRPRPDDAADALAVALYAGREWRVSQMANLEW